MCDTGYVDVEFPKQFEDRHAPDDYGFIQSTIYTVTGELLRLVVRLALDRLFIYVCNMCVTRMCVTACALIFMLAVVLLVSAICKMHMKRAALRQYTQPDLYHRHQVRYVTLHLRYVTFTLRGDCGSVGDRRVMRK